MGATSGAFSRDEPQIRLRALQIGGTPQDSGFPPWRIQARKLSRHMLQRGGVVVPERQSSMGSARVRKPQTSHPPAHHPGPTIPTNNRDTIAHWTVEQTCTAGAHLPRRSAAVVPVRLMATDDCRGAEGETASDHSGSGPSPHVGTMNCALCARHFPVHGVPCAGTRLRLPIHLIPRTTYGRVLWTGRRPCPECATSPGSPHHMPCDREYCPACVDGQRLTSCLDHFLWTALPSPAGRGTASRVAQPPPVWQAGQK